MFKFNLEVKSSAYTVTVYSENLPDEAYDHIDNTDKPVVAMAEASAISCFVVALTYIALTVAVVINMVCLLNYIVMYAAASETLDAVFISVCYTCGCKVGHCFPLMTELFELSLNYLAASCTFFNFITRLHAGCIYCLSNFHFVTECFADFCYFGAADSTLVVDIATAFAICFLEVVINGLAVLINRYAMLVA